MNLGNTIQPVILILHKPLHITENDETHPTLFWSQKGKWQTNLTYKSRWKIPKQNVTSSNNVFKKIIIMPRSSLLQNIIVTKTLCSAIKIHGNKV